MLRELRPALVLLVLISLLTGLVYPFAITGLAKILFPHQAAGSLIEADGKVIGSELIGQSFTSDKYFHGRISAITATDAQNNSTPDPYDPTSSSGSNLGPTSQALLDRVKGDVAKLNGENTEPVPVDLVTSSASGLDPDISPEAAEFQAVRVAKARGLSEEAILKLIEQSTVPETLGLLGERRVNVLHLNQALDAMVTK
jgi:K+-transporting ATPase ATPase C chain